MAGLALPWAGHTRLVPVPRLNLAVVAGRPLLATFGAGYAAEGAAPLIVLTLATLPGIIKVHFIQVYRIEGRLGTAAAIAGAGAVLELSAAAIGARQGGLVGLSVGFAIAMLLEAFAMSPLVVGAAGLWRRPLGPAGHASINGTQQPDTNSDD